MWGKTGESLKGCIWNNTLGLHADSTILSAFLKVYNLCAARHFPTGVMLPGGVFFDSKALWVGCLSWCYGQLSRIELGMPRHAASVLLSATFGRNSIAFGSAPRRAVDSQPISP